MEPAIIRLAKKLELTAATTHSELIQLWNGINENIQHLNSRRGSSPLNWRNIHQRFKDDLIREATDYGEGIRQLLRNRLPYEINLTASERSFVIESSRTEIADFTEQPQSLVLNYFLITEQLTLIDAIGDRLLLAKGDHTKAL